MSTALEEALEAAKSLPAKRQEQIAKWVADIVAQDLSAARLTAEQNAEVHRRVHDASEEPVSEGEADAFFELSDASSR